MNWIYYLLLIATGLGGLALNVLGLPGLWILLLGVIGYAWITGWGVFVGATTIAVLFCLAILAEVFEFFAGAAGAKKAGGTQRGMIGSVVGGLVGGLAGSLVIPIPIVGTIVGAVAGSFAGAAGVERLIEPDLGRALKIGAGAAAGRLAGILIKSGFGILMFLISIVIAFPVHFRTAPVAPASPAASSQPSTAPSTGVP